ncbi:hypothetical protein BAY61_29620 [Prauserella marina]|uniref:Uncharacterized protein n=1 Tax=Prauserella marina TaxID=530584 RepID=A0A222VXS5_9PSEU|nr:hypothetical protein [Prauserella marina]ASR38473.1 hypothetical protein BAY61_29620 [Prauserella marina]PWV78283.1 hypothetical protein DES30_10411 [Prauserella marina]SDC82533.1 hypothetical protein SAMN05421630_10411 [Prauserella marina]
MTDEPTAAVRYKEIIGSARRAADDLRAWELARAEELTAAIAAANEEVTAAAEREAATEERATRWWRMASDSVSRLSWLDVGTPPEPARSARGEWLDRYAEDVRPAYHDLTQAILKLGWRAR